MNVKYSSLFCIDLLLVYHVCIYNYFYDTNINIFLCKLFIPLCCKYFSLNLNTSLCEFFMFMKYIITSCDLYINDFSNIVSISVVYKYSPI